MPYITDEQRKALDVLLAPENAGQFNYCLTTLILDYIDRKGNCYQTINDIVGAVICCIFEFYRRHAAPYEDIKIKENGDVYF